MTRDMMQIGFLATALIFIVFGLAMLREPSRQIEAAEHLQTIAIQEGTDLYAENCVICHGASGQGFGAYPALGNEGISTMDEKTLSHIIERGRYNTAMASFGVDEGGIFTNSQIDSLVTLLQNGNWVDVSLRVAELGLTPPSVVVAEIPPEMLTMASSLPDGGNLVEGLNIYAENCIACHGANGEGTTLAPQLNSVELRNRLADGDIIRIVEEGVPGTLMASWGAALTAEEVQAVVGFIRRWPEITQAGVGIPVVEAVPLDMSPEAIVTGQRLFSILCQSCHGADGYGSPMAPALNNQLFLNQTPDTAIQQIIAMGVSGTVMPAWGGRLNDADIAALTAYLRSLAPTAPVIVNPNTNSN
jgi:mono/diheme cytochrome c family protein